MAFKGGGMRTLVRAHDEVPCITAIITRRNPEEDFCILAQHARMACNPAGITLPEPRSTAYIKHSTHAWSISSINLKT